jgi:hypothetical protein
MTRFRLPAVALAASLCAAGAGATRADSTIVRLPAGGIQPHAAVDSRGVAHVVYFSGDPANGDLFYTRLGPDDTFSAPVRVNSDEGSAIAASRQCSTHG